MELRFPAGRYHATPWGRNVNEAEVEWPPAPWRILRALIATWHRKVDAGRFPDALLGGLVDSLAASLPVYRLPDAIRSHTRHYMPLGGRGASNRTLVFDAFVAVEPDAALLVEWADAFLEPPERELLVTLADRMGYLGRAESWVEARVVDASEPPNCVPAPHEVASADESVAVLAPLSSAAYAEARAVAIDRFGLTGGRLRAREKRVLETLPERLVDALRLETSALLRSGWSHPPAARVVGYLRPRDCFMARPRFTPSPGRLSSTTVRLALVGKPLPRIEDALRIGEAVRWAAIKVADRIAGDAENVPPVLSGHDLPADNTHGHAFYLAEDADNDGRVDHVLIHAPAGLSRHSVAALGSIDAVWTHSGSKWRTVFEGEWERPSDAPSQYTGTGDIWTSMTPYLHPWFAKRGFGVREQVARECTLRGLPAPVTVESVAERIVKGRPRRPVHFHRFRRRRADRQPDRQGHFLRLTFPVSIEGPLALGYACHYGLGIFSPQDLPR